MSPPSLEVIILVSCLVVLIMIQAWRLIRLADQLFLQRERAEMWGKAYDDMRSKYYAKLDELVELRAELARRESCQEPPRSGPYVKPSTEVTIRLDQQSWNQIREGDFLD